MVCDRHSEVNREVGESQVAVGVFFLLLSAKAGKMDPLFPKNLIIAAQLFLTLPDLSSSVISLIPPCSATMPEANPAFSTVKTLHLFDSVFADAHMTESGFHKAFDEWWCRLRDGKAPAGASALGYMYTVRFEAASALARLLRAYQGVPAGASDVMAVVRARLQAAMPRITFLLELHDIDHPDICTDPAWLAATVESLSAPAL